LGGPPGEPQCREELKERKTKKILKKPDGKKKGQGLSSIPSAARTWKNKDVFGERSGRGLIGNEVVRESFTGVFDLGKGSGTSRKKKGRERRWGKKRGPVEKVTHHSGKDRVLSEGATCGEAGASQDKSISSLTKKGGKKRGPAMEGCLGEGRVKGKVPERG